jgi:hypothetical protein
MDRVRALIRCFSLLGKAWKKIVDVNWVCMHSSKRDEYYDCFGFHRLNKKRRDRICNIVYVHTRVLCMCPSSSCCILFIICSTKFPQRCKKQHAWGLMYPYVNLYMVELIFHSSFVLSRSMKVTY